jgi:hypothetical protein
MTDPPRLVESCSDELARALLSSSRDDVGSSRAYERTLASLGAGAVVELATAGTANAATLALTPAGKLGVLGVVKLLSVGAALGVATMAALHFTTTAVRAPAPAPSDVFSNEPALPRAKAAENVTAPAPVLPVEPKRAPARSVRSAAPSPPPSASPEPAPVESFAPVEDVAPPPSAVAGTLEREVKMLDAAKQALARGAAHDALSALGAYEREFERGALAPEAQVLRVRALLAAGDREAASAAARRVIASDPEGRHAVVVRALLERGANP